MPYNSFFLQPSTLHLHLIVLISHLRSDTNIAVKYWKRMEVVWVTVEATRNFVTLMTTSGTRYLLRLRCDRSRSRDCGNCDVAKVSLAQD